MVSHGGVDRNSSAQQRPHMLALQGLWNGDGKAGVHPDGVGVSAISANAGGLRGSAEVLVTLATPFAYAAAIRLPADAHALAQCEVAHQGANRRDRAYNFMPGDEGELTDPPVVVNQMNV